MLNARSARSKRRAHAGGALQHGCPALQAIGCAWLLHGCASDAPLDNLAHTNANTPVDGAAGGSGTPVAAQSGSGPVVISQPVATGGVAGITVAPTAPMRPIPSGAGASRDAGVAAVTPLEPDDDAGPPGAAALSCSADAGWQLAPGFVLSQHVDYVEDRSDQQLPPRLSSAGVACATAKDKLNCQANLAVPTSFGRVLVTTTGDDVRFWQGQAAITLLGLIDTEAEALWVASQGYALSCTATVKRSGKDFIVDGLISYLITCMAPDNKPLQEHLVSAKIYANAGIELLTPTDPSTTACTAPPSQ